MRTLLTARLSLMLVPAMLGVPMVGSAEGPESTLSSATDLMSEPGGAREAVLLPGASVRVIETRDGWSRVVLEGWVRAEAGAPDSQPPSAPPKLAIPQDGGISGAIFVTDAKGRTAVGAGIALRLMTDASAAASEISTIRGECDASGAAMKAEAAALKDRGDRAMKTIENPSKAFEAYDEAKRQRMEKVRQIKQHDDECAARVETVYDAHAALRALSDSEGRFALAHVPPGRYTLHASFEAGGTRHEWDVDVTMESGQNLILDLTNANRVSATPAPVYR